jgi:hypothetical protein
VIFTQRVLKERSLDIDLERTSSGRDSFLIDWEIDRVFEQEEEENVDQIRPKTSGKKIK